jgi:hypothetical protein
MIDGNTIVFGYGTIIVRANYFGVSLTETDRPLSLGPVLRETYNTLHLLETVDIEHGDDFIETISNLRKLNENNSTLKFRDLIFDFNNFNQKSVNSLIKAFSFVVLEKNRALAC